MKKSFYILIVLSLAMLNGCYYDNEEELYPESFNCNPGDVTYDIIKPIIDANCATSGCHVAGTGRKDLRTYQGMKDIMDDGRLNERVIVKQDMPPSGPLSKCYIAKIEAWIAQGGPQ